MDTITTAATPLRQRMLEDVRMRKLEPRTQEAHIRALRKVAAYLRGSPDTATVDDLRNFQLHLAYTGASQLYSDRVRSPAGQRPAVPAKTREGEGQLSGVAAEGRTRPTRVVRDSQLHGGLQYRHARSPPSSSAAPADPAAPALAGVPHSIRETVGNCEAVIHSRCEGRRPPTDRGYPVSRSVGASDSARASPSTAHTASSVG
jgi:hypothetical protein